MNALDAVKMAQISFKIITMNNADNFKMAPANSFLDSMNSIRILSDGAEILEMLQIAGNRPQMEQNKSHSSSLWVSKSARVEYSKYL